MDSWRVRVRVGRAPASLSGSLTPSWRCQWRCLHVGYAGRGSDLNNRNADSPPEVPGSASPEVGSWGALGLLRGLGPVGSGCDGLAGAGMAMPAHTRRRIAAARFSFILRTRLPERLALARNVGQMSMGVPDSAAVPEVKAAGPRGVGAVALFE